MWCCIQRVSPAEGQSILTRHRLKLYNNFYLITLSILITYLLDNVWILKGEVTS